MRKHRVTPGLPLAGGYARKKVLERVKGIEPSYAAWEAAVLPLNYTRVIASHFTVTEWIIDSDCRQH
jgi:hypothetical protein